MRLISVRPDASSYRSSPGCSRHIGRHRHCSRREDGQGERARSTSSVWSTSREDLNHGAGTREGVDLLRGFGGHSDATA